MDMNKKLKEFSAATNNELYDADEGYEEWMVEAVETQETIDDFKAARAGWNEKGNLQAEGTIAGFPFITWSSVQAMKGQPRRNVSVIDFDDCRIVLDADITDFDYAS